MKNILLTGGMGYIGSHTAIELIKNGYQPIIVDNLTNSSIEVLDKLKEITNQQIPFYELDVCDPKIEQIFKDHKIDAVIHFAGLKAVGESVEKPLSYYRNNIDSTLNLLEIMRKNQVNKLIFSSSATVYGNINIPPYTEDMTIGSGITNPYGQTKFMIEQIIKDFSVANPNFHSTMLRYFNPVGAHESGLIGEDPKDIPNNLLPYVLRVATGEYDKVRVFGSDYDTPDGTGIRDFIHVVDLAKGHVAALKHLDKPWQAINLGTGKGSSVMEVISYVEQACGKKLPTIITERRPGDLAVAIADVEKAKQVLNWQAKKTVKEACFDSWNWVK